MPESSYFIVFWTPAFAGVTTKDFLRVRQLLALPGMRQGAGAFQAKEENRIAPTPEKSFKNLTDG